MAKRRRDKRTRTKTRRRRRRMTALQRRFFGKRRRSAPRKRHHHMAKRKRRSGGRRRSSGRRTARRRHHGGGGSGLALVKHDMPKMVTAAVYGKLESLAKADANFFLNKVPRPIAALGYTGNIAAMLYLASMFVRHPYVKLGASTVATIAFYKLGKNGAAFTSSDTTTIGSSYDGDVLEGGAERIIDDNMMGALDVEATRQHESRQGIPYDDVVRDAGTRV